MLYHNIHSKMNLEDHSKKAYKNQPKKTGTLIKVPVFFILLIIFSHIRYQIFYILGLDDNCGASFDFGFNSELGLSNLPVFAIISSAVSFNSSSYFKL